jgi:hypothetical protein
LARVLKQGLFWPKIFQIFPLYFLLPNYYLAKSTAISRSLSESWAVLFPLAY